MVIVKILPQLLLRRESTHRFLRHYLRPKSKIEIGSPKFGYELRMLYSMETGNSNLSLCQCISSSVIEIGVAKWLTSAIYRIAKWKRRPNAVSFLFLFLFYFLNMGQTAFDFYFINILYYIYLFFCLKYLLKNSMYEIILKKK